MKLRFLKRVLQTIVMVLCLLPGMPQLLENAEHLLHDGHLPHSAEHEQHAHAESHGDTAEREHSCTPLAHHCPCHSSTPVILGRTASALERTLQTELSAAPSGRLLAQRSRESSPPTPPPTA